MERQRPPMGGEFQDTPEQAESWEERHDEEEQTRIALMEHISAAGVTTLGRVATVVTAGHAVDDGDEEVDTLPWTDAARWSPAQVARTETESDERDRLDSLFGEIADEEIGTIEGMGWFGLLRNEGQLGGIVLSQNQYGFRSVWEIGSDDRLARHWDELQREYDSFMEATHAHNHEPGEREGCEHEATDSGHHPEIWVGSLSDYNNGRLHGAWLDATLGPSELRDAIQFMLRGSYVPGAEEWAIMDYDDFCGVSLGEYESLDVVSRVAGGIAEHGEPFAKWVECVGERSEEALGRFEDHYLGHFDSTEAYAEYILEETGSYEFMDYVPESLRPYVKVDIELMTRDMEIELYVTEGEGGGVYVFDPRG